MAEPAATMSGANDVVEEVEKTAVAEQQSGESSSSLPTAAAEQAAIASGTGASAAAETAAQTEADTRASTAVPATDAASAGGVLEAPRPPPAAVVRGPSNPDDEIAPVISATAGPMCNITLLLPTGNRHPFKIDDRYLNKRGVEVPELTEAGLKDPFSISVYKLKELILREWREDWESKPASPSSIRLIHFGKLLDDKEQLRKYHFSPDAPNVVHMSVKPPEMMEDDEAAKGKSGGRESRGARENGGGCCVIL